MKIKNLLLVGLLLLHAGLQVEGTPARAENDSTLLYMGVPEDSAFLAEFDSLRNTNIGRYGDVEDALAAGKRLEALNRLYSIVDITVFDQNKRYVASLIAVDYDPGDDEDGDTLEVLTAIAMMHPFYGGEAVYWARAILHIIVDDELPPLRRAHIVQQQSITSVSSAGSGKLYPNPANDQVTYQYSGNSPEKLRLVIHDKLGRLICQYELHSNSFTFNTSQYTEGIYQVTIYEGDNASEFHKLIIIK